MRLSLTRQADHALRAMVWLAGQPASTRCKAAAIAGAVGIPRPFAARVLAPLRRMGLLVARAGHDGGYTLARRPSEVTLLDVIEAFEGPLRARAAGCTTVPARPTDSANPMARRRWRKRRSAACSRRRRSPTRSEMAGRPQRWPSE